MFKQYALITCLLFCCWIAAAEQPDSSESVLKIGLMGDITGLYPWGDISLETHYVMYNIFETLVRYSEDGLNVEPGLARKIDASEDYRTWTVYLRKDITFHDGGILNADAVMSSLSLHSDLQNRIKKIDDYILVISLEKPHASFPLVLTMSNYSIGSPETINCHKRKCEKPVVAGTGPFTLKNWIPGKEVILAANEQYWGEKPGYKKVSFIPVKNDEELIEKLKNKSIDISPAISPNYIKQIREVPHLIFRTSPTLCIGFLAMNTEKKPFNNVKVRLAISHAIDKTELVKNYFFGGQAGTAATTFAPLAMVPLADESLAIQYDPEKAKTLLKEAGYPDGFEATLMPTPIRRPYMPEPLKIAEDIAKYLSEIGIKVKISPPASRNDFGSRTRNGAYDMMLFGWLAETADPDMYLSALLASNAIGLSNTSRWSNNKFDTLIEQARSQINPAARLRIYHQAQLIFHQEMPFVPLFSPYQITVWNETVHGFAPHPVNRLYLDHLSPVSIK